MSSHRLSQPARRGQRGFSLIEILVAMVIAMIAVVIMMEVLLNSDQRTRTSNAGNDALGTGAVMLHMLRRDVQQAGYGINTINLLGCSLTMPSGAAVPLAPVVINPPAALVPAGDANTDTMIVVYGNANGQPEGNSVFSVDAAAKQYTMQSPSAFAQNDYVIAYAGSCGAALGLEQVTDVAALTVTVDTVEPSAVTLYNLGPNPRIVAYAVRNGQLTSCDFMTADCRVNNAANWTAVAGGVVSLRAQYGRDTAATGSMDGAADVWDQTTPSVLPAPAPSLQCQWARIPAVRFALVARSSQYESRFNTTTGQRECDPVTAAAPTWLGSAADPVDLSADADWQCYRYKTLQTVAPSRNIVWMGSQAGC